MRIHQPANDNFIEKHYVPKRNGEVLVDGAKLNALRFKVQEVNDTLPHFLVGAHEAQAQLLVAPLTRTEVIQRINGIPIDSLTPRRAAYYRALLNRLTEEGD